MPRTRPRYPPEFRQEAARLARLCVLKFDETTHEMYLAERHEGVTPEQVPQNTGFAPASGRARVSRGAGGTAKAPPGC
jgi:hypothetical protein